MNETTWIVGNNQPGYMPVGEPYEVDTWGEAWECLKSDLIEWAECDDESHDDLATALGDDLDPDYSPGSSLALVEGWIKDEEPHITARLAGQEVEVSFSGNDDWPMSFWIMEVEGEA